MKQIITILPDYCYNEEKSASIPNELKDKVFRHPHGDWWFLHGHVEDIVRYDKGNFIDVPTELTKKTYRWKSGKGMELKSDSEVEVNAPYLKGAFECKLVGIDTPCVGYFWVVDEGKHILNGHIEFEMWRQEGLVCLYNDGDANAYARRLMEENISL